MRRRQKNAKNSQGVYWKIKMGRNNDDWGKLVLICIVILAVIALFKFLFWMSILAGVVGLIWLIINLFSGDHEYSWIPAIVIIGGIILGIISYQIGYEFEKSGLGKPIVDGAKAIVETDNTIKEVEQNVTNQLIDATAQATGDIGK